jgi:hypothetical protein
MSDAADGPVVWIIDSEHWPRAYLRAELIERGYDAVGYREIVDALVALRLGRAARPSIVLLELRGQRKSPETLGALVQTGAPIVLLGGEVELNDDAIRGYHWTAVMKRPVTIGAVVERVEELMRGSHEGRLA